MIITRTPLRISVGGGGCDLPSYYTRRDETLVISAAIDKYCYIAVNDTFTDDYVIKYSELERVPSVDAIQHNIVREALKAHPVGPAKEIVSVADIPAGTGLGSSGTFTVGLLRALTAYTKTHTTAAELAEQACHLEMVTLGQPVGKQDQYIAAFGGVSCLDFDSDGQVTVSRLLMADETLRDLQSNLLLFFTGYSRQATSILADQERRSVAGEESMLANLDHVQELGRRIKRALEAGDCEGYAGLMHEHWVHKRERSTDMSNPNINRWYDLGIEHGALGGKLVGAGAGGFLLFYAKDQVRLREVMATEGLREVPFRFDHDGSVVTVRG